MGLQSGIYCTKFRPPLEAEEIVVSDEGIEFRIQTEKAQEFYDSLTALGVQQGTPADAEKPRR